MSSTPASAKEKKRGEGPAVNDVARGSALHALRMGTRFMKMRDWETAAVWFGQAAKIQPTFFEAYFLLGDVYVEMGRLDEAVETYRFAIKLRPDGESTHFKLGLAYVARNDWNSALGQYHTLRTLNQAVAGELFDKIIYAFNYQMFESLFSHVLAG